MIIQLTKCERSYWRANLADLPGSPFIGEGHSSLEATCSLFFRILSQNTRYKCIDFSEMKIEYVKRDAF